MSHFVRRRTRIRDREILMYVLKQRGFTVQVDGDTISIPGEEFGCQEGSILWKMKSFVGIRAIIDPVRFCFNSGEYVMELNDDLILGAMHVGLMEGLKYTWTDIDPLKRGCTEFMAGANYPGQGMDRNFEVDIWKDYAVEQVRRIAQAQGQEISDITVNADGSIRVTINDEIDAFAGDAFAETSTSVQTEAYVELF